MASNGSGKDNTMLFVLLGAVGLTLAAVVPVLLFGQGEGKANALIILGFITPIIGVLLLMLQSQQTAKIAAQGLLAAARAAAEAAAARNENAKTNDVLADVSKQVDGVMHELNKAQVGEAAANATLDQMAVGKKEAASLAVITKAELADAIAAPAMVSAGGNGDAPAVTTSDGALDVNVVNSEVPVKVDQVTKPKER